MNSFNKVLDVYRYFFVVETNDFDEMRYRKKNTLAKYEKSFRKKKKKNFIVKEKKVNFTEWNTDSLLNIHYIILIKMVDFLDRF